MEAKIQRGRLLREILRQERMAPQSAEFQAAWLTAFNEGYLDNLRPAEIIARLRLLETVATSGSISLDDDQNMWRDAVSVLFGKENANGEAK